MEVTLSSHSVGPSRATPVRLFYVVERCSEAVRPAREGGSCVSHRLMSESRVRSRFAQTMPSRRPFSLAGLVRHGPEGSR